MNTEDNNAVFNNTDEYGDWPYIAYTEDYLGTILKIFFSEKDREVFLKDNRYMQYEEEVQRLFDEKIRPELDRMEDCWESYKEEKFLSISPSI